MIARILDVGRAYGLAGGREAAATRQTAQRRSGMMKPLAIIVATAALAMAAPAVAELVQLDYENGPQDPLSVPKEAEELGIGFPPDELIMLVDWVDTDRTACPEDPGDNPAIPNALVSMTKNHWCRSVH